MSEPASETSATRSSQAETNPAPWYRRHLWQMVPLQDALWLAIPVLLIWFLFRYAAVSIPLLIGFTLAYTVQPLLSFAEQRWKIDRDVLVGSILAAVVLIACGLTALLIPFLADQTLTLVDNAPGYAERARAWLEQNADRRWLQLLPELEDAAQGNTDQAVSVAMQGLDHALNVVLRAMGTTGFVLTIVTTVPIYFLFFAWHYLPMLRAAKDLLPDQHRDPIIRTLSKMDRVVGGFIRGRLIVMVAMMFMFSVGFWLTNVPFWLLIGCVTGILSFVPYAPVLGWLAAMLAVWLQGAVGTENSLGLMEIVVWPTVAYSVVQLLEGWVLTPWIQSQSMNLSATAILVVLLIGGAVGGFVGLLLAIPVAGCGRILIEDLLLPRLKAWTADT